MPFFVGIALGASSTRCPGPNRRAHAHSLIAILAGLDRALVIFFGAWVSWLPCGSG
jgi:hypothetical protein